MRYQSFIGPSAAVQSPIANSASLINWYLEKMDVPGSPATGVLCPTPGTAVFGTSSAVGGRAAFSVAGRTFFVIGGSLEEVLSTGLIVTRGTVAQDSNQATISYNGSAGGQLFITSGGNGYCYDLASNTLTQELTGDATMGGYQGTRFLAFDLNTGMVRMSDANDGTTWDPSLFFQREQAPDPWKAMVVWNAEIWLIGEFTGEVYYNSGAFPQPYAPIPGAIFNYGTQAPFSVTLANNMLVWSSHTTAGSAIIVGARGYVPQVISNNTVNTSLGRMDRSTGIDDCESLVYEEDGHVFVAFSFPASNTTWVLDLGSGDWHQRGRWNSVLGRYDVWEPRVHCHAFGQHLVAGRSSGVIAKMNIGLVEEFDGSTIRRVRVGPPLWASSSRQRLQIDRLDLTLDTGLGTNSGQGLNPQVMMRTTADSRIWSPLRQAAAGKRGEYNTSVYWTRLGSAERVWFPEITVTDPIPWRIAGAEIQGSGFEQGREAA